MEFRMLGPLEVVVDDQPLAFGKGKQRSLLAVLLLHANEVVSADRLIDELWGERPPPTAPTGLQGYIYQLRKLLGPERVETHARGYRLRVERDELDRDRFEALVADGRYRDALALWRGPALADVAYEPFAQREIVRLEELRLATLEQRIDADLSEGRDSALVGELEALVQEHPMRERFRAQLMLALYRSGRQADALECYRQTRRLLVEELGLEPGEALQRLERAILSHDAALEPPFVVLGPVAAGASSEPPPAPPVAEPRRERKVVTVLFADLVRFTGSAEQPDPEDVEAILRRYHDGFRRELECFEGTVERFIGDAVMALFGAPVAHEDDPERAVRAALAVRDWAIGEALEVRVAVTTGEAVVHVGSRSDQGEPMAAGDVVSTAARLKATAPTNGILVSERTHRATRHVIDYRRAEPVRANGNTRPIRVWEAKQARSRSRVGPQSRFGVDVEQPAPSPLIGREHELALFSEIWVRAVREPSVQFVTVTGEPGIGKTRLISEFRETLQGRSELVRWRQGGCRAYGDGITFWAFGEVVKAEAGILESDTVQVAGAKLRDALAGVVGDPSEQAWLAAKLAPLIGIPEAAGGSNRAESFAAWRRFLEALASSRPLVVVLEDLHWADEPLLEFVEHLVDWSVDIPLLVACTARPELYERRPGWGGGKRNSTTIALSPLSSDETAQLISQLLARPVLAAKTQTELLERAGGNPFYVEEFVRMLADEDVSDLEARLPETVHALVAARLDTLPPHRKALLHDAAVVGNVFWAGAVGAIGGSDPGVVREGLHELVRKELVRPTRTSSIHGEDEFAFRHSLVRDVAYEQIPRAARAQQHRGAAEWIERIAGDRIEDRAEILVHHYRQALELAQAGSSDTEAAQAEEQLRRFLVLAGDRAIDLDVAKADQYYRHALDLLRADDVEWPRVVVKAARAADLAGRFAEGVTLLEDAIDRFRSQGERVAEADAKVRLGCTIYGLGDVDRGQALLWEAVSTLERERRGPELAEAYASAAGLNVTRGNGREALEWLDKCVPLAEQFELKSVLANALFMRGSARVQLGDLDGVEDMQDSLPLVLAVGDACTGAGTYSNLGQVLWPIEGPAKALELKREGIALAERRGIEDLAMWIKGAMFWMLHDLGEWDECLRNGDDVHAWFLQRSPEEGRIHLSRSALIHIRRGEVEEAAALNEEFMPASRARGEVQILVPALAAAALIAQAQGDLPAAVAFADELERETRDAPGWNRFSAAVDVVRIAAAAEEFELGERMLERVDPAARSRHCVVAGRAVLAEAYGCHEEALMNYTDAAERWRDFGFVFEHGQALLGAGRCLLALDHHSEAHERLNEARRIFARLRAAPSLAETDGALAQATAVSA